MNTSNYLFPNYLGRLNHGNHFWATSLIDEIMAAFETENPLIIEARSSYHTAFSSEDAIWHSYSNKDFASDDLLKADEMLNKLMSIIRYTMKKVAGFPETQPMRRVGEIA